MGGAMVSGEWMAPGVKRALSPQWLDRFLEEAIQIANHLVEDGHPQVGGSRLVAVRDEALELSTVPPVELAHRSVTSNVGQVMSEPTIHLTERFSEIGHCLSFRLVESENTGSPEIDRDLRAESR